MKLYVFFISLNWPGKQDCHTIQIKTKSAHQAMTQMMWQWKKLQREYKPETSIASLEAVVEV